jgi:hypothetical protein
MFQIKEPFSVHVLEKEGIVIQEGSFLLTSTPNSKS